MNKVKRILNFWKEVNLLTPVTVKSIAFKNQESLSVKDVLKVPYNRIEDSLLLNNDEKYELHRLIGALLSDRLRENEKLDIIEKEYKIPLSNDFRKEVDTMCNLSQGIVDRTEERMLIDFVMNMYKNKFSLEQISLATKKSVDEVKKIIEEQEAVLV